MISDINLYIAGITNVVSFYDSLVMLYWWLRLRRENIALSPLIHSIFLGKAAVWYWTATGMFQILVVDTDLPIWSLPARLVWLYVVLVQATITFRYYRSSPDLDEKAAKPFLRLDRNIILIILVSSAAAFGFPAVFFAWYFVSHSIHEMHGFT